MTRNKRILFVLSTICAALVASELRAQEIPSGVRYKRASDAINKKAQQMLESAVSAKTESMDVDGLFGGVIACGPLLWDTVQQAASDKFPGATPMVLVINAPTPLRKEGRGIKQAEQKRLLWKILLEEVKGDAQVSIRKGKASEIQYYWATIPFDIEEPFLIMDFGLISVLVNFTIKNGEPRIFWIDIVGDLSKLK